MAGMIPELFDAGKRIEFDGGHVDVWLSMPEQGEKKAQSKSWSAQQAAILEAFSKSFTPKDEGPSRHSLEVVDFVRFPDDMKDGTRCSNCQYEDGGTCHFHGDINGNAVDLRGLQVFHDTCCAAWDRDGVTRPWEKGEGEKAWEGVLDLDATPRLLRDAPDVRQPNRYFCGAAATKCVLGYYGVGPESLEEVAEALGTTVERSTHPYAIRDYLESLGLQVEAQDGMSILDLDSYTKRGYPVIVCVQDYGQEVPDKNNPGAKGSGIEHFLSVSKYEHAEELMQLAIKAVASEIGQEAIEKGKELFHS